jgi:hypothetical protein
MSAQDSPGPILSCTCDWILQFRTTTYLYFFSQLCLPFILYTTTFITEPHIFFVGYCISLYVPPIIQLEQWGDPFFHSPYMHVSIV